MIDISVVLALLLGLLVADSALPSVATLVGRGMKGTKNKSGPEGSFLFLKCLLWRCAGGSTRCGGFVGEMTSDRLFDMEKSWQLGART